MSVRAKIVLSFFFLAVGCGILLLFMSPRAEVSREQIQNDIDIYLPLTQQSFPSIFHLDSLRYSQYGDQLRNCVLTERSVSTHGDAIEEEVGVHFLGTLSVVSSVPHTWIDILVDNRVDIPCYRLFVGDLKSWLICFRDGDVIRFMNEISNLCGIHSNIPDLFSFYV